MFSQVVKYLVGILRSVYGITTSVVSSVINTVVTGKLIVRATGGVAGTDELQISHDTSRQVVLNSGVSSTSLTYLIQAGGNTIWSFVTDFASPAFAIRSANATIRLGALDASSAGLGRAATGVLRPLLGDAAVGGWLQNTGGETRRIATQTVTDSTTFTADDTLVHTLIAGRKYRFYLWYAFTVVNSSGVKIDLNGGTATMTAINGMIYLMSSAGAISNFAQITALTSSAALTATGTLHYGLAEGSLQCNAAGTFAPRFAQNAETGAAESAVAQIGSYLTLADMP